MPPLSSIAVLRERLRAGTGREYWRSLEELAETEEFRDFARHEFPAGADLWPEPATRREFLRLMGASLAVAFFAGCRRPLDAIVPYSEAPPDAVPGKPLYFASALPHQGYARGVLVENHQGRPTKIEGNPAHPDSLGATDLFMQAAILGFYDPDRSQAATLDGEIATWDDFRGALAGVAALQDDKKGAGLRVLTETVTSPTLAAQMSRLRRRFPKARWHRWEPAGRDNARAGAALAFGEPVETIYRVEKADVIVSLDADFLVAMPGGLRYARDFSARRAPPNMNRLYVVETNPSVTGGMADHRLPARPSAIAELALDLEEALSGRSAPRRAGRSAAESAWLAAAAADLRRSRGTGLVIAGEGQPPLVHALAHAMNRALGGAGRTVSYAEPVEAEPEDHLASLKALAHDMRGGKVDAVLILGGNPAFNAPADLGFADALARVPFRAHLSLEDDETSASCRWHVPEAHPLESWGDLRAFDGTVSIVQPQIQPLYDGKTSAEVLSALLDEEPRSAHDLVRERWAVGEDSWRRALSDGVLEGTAAKPLSPALKSFPRSRPGTPPEGLEVVFQSDPTVGDGRHANNGWLQELPKPMTKLTWDNAALLAPALAERLGVENGDVVELAREGRSLEAPVWIVPGHADGAVTLTLGYGRSRAGRVARGAGVNAYALRTSDALWSGGGVAARRAGRRAELAATQHHFSMEGRGLVRVGTAAEHARTPGFAKRPGEKPTAAETLYGYSKPAVSSQYAWGMAIDLNKCIGCAACTLACQAENNIPVVGKDQVSRGREMHWIRVDRYFSGDLDTPSIVSQPVPCMHCEDAPCEPVCPVGATQHSEEGLNEMVYNRCVGTRFCSNNCPYKVRRFNFFFYSDYTTPSVRMVYNPDVTVRSRGVMEKCSYCVQRIQDVRIKAEKENRPIRDLEILTACQQACPTQAIVFGDGKNS
ncbi:MAG TPA: TAT-variant-translocated molybdopterin oxidoreductase, partial [Elusimicrobiota bacterium]|nr:TAT-variant-translocated molybdopterin oxidoreductase [Elusimicrobiota bacterium]